MNLTEHLELHICGGFFFEKFVENPISISVTWCRLNTKWKFGGNRNDGCVCPTCNNDALTRWAHQVGSAKWDSVGRTKTPSASTGRRRWCPTLCVTWWGRAAVWAAPRGWAMVNLAIWEGPNEAAAAKEEEKEAEAPPVIKEVHPIPTAGKRRQALDEGTCRAHPPLSLTATAHVIKTGRLLALQHTHTHTHCFCLSTNPPEHNKRIYHIMYTDIVLPPTTPKTGRDLFFLYTSQRVALYTATETLIVAIVHTTAGNTLQQRNYTTNFSPLLTRKRERNEAKHEIASRTVERKKNK